MSDDIENNLLEAYFPNHTVIRTDRKTNLGGKTKNGRVLVAIPEHYMHSKHRHFSNGYVEVVAVLLDTLCMCIVNAYCPGDTPINKFKEMIDNINEYLSTIKAKIVLCGDFNLPPGIVDWINGEEDETFVVISTGREDDTEISQKRDKAALLFDTAENYLLEQIVNIPTCKNNIIDLVFTSEICNNVTTITDEDISDHNLVICDFQNETTEKPDSVKNFVLSTNKMDEKDLNESLGKCNWDEIFEHMTPAPRKDKLVEILMEQMIKAGASWINTNRTNKYICNLMDKQRKMKSCLKYVSTQTDKAILTRKIYK